jgi:hypothetical protein
VYGAPAINKLNAPLKVRWQFAQPNPAWQEATVAVPAFAKQSSATRNAVHLYFRADGTVAAQWEQMLTSTDGKPSVRFTDPSAQVTFPARCGTASDVHRMTESYRTEQ